MPYATGRTFLDADSHLMELPDFLTANADLADYVTRGPSGSQLKASDDPTPEQRECIESFYAVGANILPRLADRLKAAYEQEKR